MHFINEDLKKAILDFENTITLVEHKIESLKLANLVSVSKIEEAISTINGKEENEN